MRRYWDAASNPDGAPPDEKLELLKAGPWCYKDEAGEETIECSSKADRTQRAGIWENKRWRRDDRYARLSTLRCDQKAHDSLRPLHTDSTAAATSSDRAWCPTSQAFAQRKTAAKCLKNGIQRATLNAVRGLLPTESPDGPSLDFPSLPLPQTSATHTAQTARRGASRIFGRVASASPRSASQQQHKSRTPAWTLLEDTAPIGRQADHRHPSRRLSKNTRF